MVDIVNKYAEVNTRIPQDANNRKLVADKIIEREEVEHSIKEKTDELNSIDPAFREEKQLEIEALHERLNELNSEIKKEAQSPQKDNTYLIDGNPVTEKEFNEAIDKKQVADYEYNGEDETIIQKLKDIGGKSETTTTVLNETGKGEVEIKNEGLADAPTKESVTERLNINNPFYKKVEDALVKLGLIEKYNPETKTGDVVGGYVQSDSAGGFASGYMYFKSDGSISYVKDGVIVQFDKNGNVVSENTKQAKSEKLKNEIEGKRSSIKFLEETRDSDSFKYKEATEFDALGNRKKVKRLKTAQELKESTDKINEQINKAKSELAELEKSQPTPQTGKGDGETTPNVEDWSRDVESTAKALDGKTEGLLYPNVVLPFLKGNNADRPDTDKLPVRSPPDRLNLLFSNPVSELPISKYVRVVPEVPEATS